MIFRRPMRHVLFALGVGAVGAVVLAVLASRGRLADHWGTQWDGLPDAQVPVRMQQLAELGDDGLATLAQALGSERPALAQAAEATLRQQVDRWRFLPPKESAANISHLARCLAKQSPHYGPNARRVASDLATQALLWPVDRHGPNRDRLVHDCAQLMRAAANDFPNPHEGERFASNPPVGEPSVVGVRRIADTRTGTIERESPAPHPGGGLPIDTAQVPAVPSSPETRNELVVVKPTRRPLPPLTMEPGDDPAAGASSGRTIDEAAVAEETPPAEFEPALSRRIPRQAPPRGDESAPPDPPGRRMGGTLTHRIDELANQDDLAVMRQLHAGDQEQAQLAREELIRRGFDERHLNMADDLTNPDPQVRLRFARALPRIPEVDVRPWLKTLAADNDPDVRMAAIAVIATSGLPESSTWLREIELRERDPRVAEQLKKALERR